MSGDFFIRVTTRSPGARTTYLGEFTPATARRPEPLATQAFCSVSTLSTEVLGNGRVPGPSLFDAPRTWRFVHTNGSNTRRVSALRRSPRTQNRRMLEAVVQLSLDSIICVNANFLTGSLKVCSIYGLPILRYLAQNLPPSHGRSVLLFLEACATVVVVSMEDLGRSSLGCLCERGPGGTFRTQCQYRFHPTPVHERAGSRDFMAIRPSVGNSQIETPPR